MDFDNSLLWAEMSWNPEIMSERAVIPPTKIQLLNFDVQ